MIKILSFLYLEGVDLVVKKTPIICFILFDVKRKKNKNLRY